MNEREPTPDPTPHRRRNRLALLGLAALFVLPILAAMWINYRGQLPAPTRQHGELLQPRPDLSEHAPVLRGGGEYAWAPSERIWRIVVAPPADCGEACLRLGEQLDTVWRLFGRNADHAHVLWLCPPDECTPPPALSPEALRVVEHDPALRAQLPRVDDPRGLPVYVVDPYGFVVLRYPPGFDPAGLREDMARLLKLM
jgi:hypothetical protein